MTWNVSNRAVYDEGELKIFLAMVESDEGIRTNTIWGTFCGTKVYGKPFPPEEKEYPLVVMVRIECGWFWSEIELMWVSYNKFYLEE